jgi:hypothetical protein
VSSGRVTGAPGGALFHEGLFTPVPTGALTSTGKAETPTYEKRAENLARIEASTGFEPVMRVLQTLALPLGHDAIAFEKTWSAASRASRAASPSTYVMSGLPIE